ncbi:MAG: single-stranded DNA-binding protein [Patescibacteria group bacterium]
MRSINKVILIGNVTRNPEMRQTTNGQKVATFTIATNRTWVTTDGRKEASSQYHDVVAWENLGEIAERFATKGKLVHVEGYLKTRSWDGPEGIKKFKTEIVIENLIILSKREEMEMNREHRQIETESAEEEPQTKVADDMTLQMEI